MRVQEKGQFALRIFEARERTGMKQSEAAQKLGITQWMLSRIETGRTEVGVALLLKMAHLYGASVGELVGEATGQREAELERLDPALLIRLREIQKWSTEHQRAVAECLDSIARFRETIRGPSDLD